MDIYTVYTRGIIPHVALYIPEAFMLRKVYMISMDIGYERFCSCANADVPLAVASNSVKLAEKL